MMKIALVYAFKESNWFSCTKIVKNLLKSYELCFKDELIKKFNYTSESSHFNYAELAEDIISFEPDKIIFVDHRPHPAHLVKNLVRKQVSKTTEFSFHVYGDFTLNFARWFSIEEDLKNYKVNFLCASDSQVELIQKLVSNKENVKKLAFPVDSTEFYPLREAPKKSIRKELGIAEDSQILLYTGRFSLTKNSIELIQVFEKFLEGNKQNVYLVLIGSFDEIAFNYGNTYHFQSEYFRMFNRSLESMANEVKERIILKPTVRNEDLLDFYQQVNYFISFSTYHDEDYGMSVAEAGACGCRLLLTDWAGYKSFNHKYTQLITTYLGEKRPSFDQEEALEKMKELDWTEIREEQASSFKEHHSVEAVANEMKEALEAKDFTGFSSFLERMVWKEQNNEKIFYTDMNRSLNNDYKEFYSSYATKNN